MYETLGTLATMVEIKNMVKVEVYSRMTVWDEVLQYINTVVI